MPITHLKVSTEPDGPDPDQINASDWNDDHDLSGLRWGDLPVSMRPTWGNLLLPGTNTASTSAYAVKGIVIRANQDITVTAVRAFQAGATSGTYSMGIAPVLSKTESPTGTIAAATFGTPLAEVTGLAWPAQQGMREAILPTPLDVAAGTDIFVYISLTSGTATGVARPQSGGSGALLVGDLFAYTGTCQIAQNPYTGGSPSIIGTGIYNISVVCYPR